AIGFTVLGNELPATLAVLRPLAAELDARVQYEEGVSKVSVVGTGMRTHTGVAEKMFAALAAEGVNMKMITTGDIKISVLVDRADGVRALRAVHQAVAGGGIVVDMIVQNLTAEGRAELSFSVPRGDLDRALHLTEDYVRGIDPQTRVVADANIAKLNVLGVGMRTHTGVARRMF